MFNDSFNNVNDFSNLFIASFITENSICLDATIGNGKDLLKIAKKLGKTGKLYGFDIQKSAITKTSELIREHNIDTEVILINDSHENLDKYIHEKLDFVIYNLGYLPGGDKSIKTTEKSTIKSIKKALQLLSHGGIILITVYLNHPGGKEEYECVLELLSNLDQKFYNVFHIKFANQINNPPIMFGVEARGGE